MTSLGNIEATPFASLTFVSFTAGSVLYLTGDAHTLVGSAAQNIMPLQNTLTTLYVTGYTFVDDALPVRQRIDTPVERSLYSPPIRYLAEETSASSTFFGEDTEVSALLTRIDIHSPSLATFTWESSENIHIKPGQAAVLDFSSFVGAQSYQHMAPGKPTAVNDDRIRTWTVSSAHLNKSHSQGTRTFALTMREKPGGAVTGALFSVARKLLEFKPELLIDTRPLELSVRLVGISGDFILPEIKPLPSLPSLPKKMLWIAGGIGLTPFLSMLSALTNMENTTDQKFDIALVLSTREPDVLLRLISQSLHGRSAGSPLGLTLDVFSDRHIPDLDSRTVNWAGVVLRRHKGRMPPTFFTDSSIGLEDREVYMCGPELFEMAVAGALAGAGLDSRKIRREGFGY